MNFSAFSVVEFDASLSDLIKIIFYLFSLADRSCYVLEQDSERPQMYVSVGHTWCAAHTANDIMNHKVVSTKDLDSLCTQIEFFIEHGKDFSENEKEDIEKRINMFVRSMYKRK